MSESTPKPAMSVSLLEWKPLRSNSLLGFASVRLGALKLRELTVHASNGRRWVGLPARPQIDKAGVAKRDGKGKIQYSPVLEWDNKDTADRFSSAVIAAIEREHPGALNSDYAP